MVTNADFGSLPKVELHRHLEGSLRLSTLVDLARSHRIDLSDLGLSEGFTAEELRPHVQITADSPATVEHFMGKFKVLRRFFCAQEVIERVVWEAVEDAALDNIRYLELRFTPRALSALMECSFDSVMRWVCQTVANARQQFAIQVRLLVSMNRHEPLAHSEKAVWAACNFREQGVVGIDLAGREVLGDYPPFVGLFREARQAGLGVTIHAGEWAEAVNVRDAILYLGATRIGHGTRVVEDDRVVQLARERRVVFEVCPSSELQTGAVKASAHPLRAMHELGLRLTINTDDPGISNITLGGELALASSLGLDDDAIRASLLTGVQSAFLTDTEREALLLDL
jgi:adenosine deaminase